MKPIDYTALSDDALFDALHEQVNLSRNVGTYNRPHTRALAAEGARRGWRLGKPGSTIRRTTTSPTRSARD